MKVIIALSTTLLAISCSPKNNNMSNTPEEKTQSSNSIYQFKVEDIEGGQIDFAKYKGKKILVVNTASACGYTPQYKQLQALYEQQKGNLVIVGFPANDFGGQEPGSNVDVKAFCEKNYGVTFPLAAKVTVKGEQMAPVYQWLTSKEKNGVLDATITWNFNKFLLNEKGELMAYFPSKVEPMSQDILTKL
jgi:glutathione peroxidase